MESDAVGVRAGLVDIKMAVVKRSANLAYIVSGSFREVKVSKACRSIPLPW